MTQPRVPPGLSSGGQFAAGAKARPDVSLRELPVDTSRAEEIQAARDVAVGMLDHAGTNLHTTIEHVYGDLMFSRNAPVVTEEARVVAIAAGLTAVIDARRSATLAARPYPGSAETGEIAYLAMAPIIDAAQRGEFVPTEQDIAATAVELGRRKTVQTLFVSTENNPDGFSADNPPTRFDVERARRLADSVSVPRPMYRGDWERINGGRGPSAGQIQAEAHSRSGASSDRASFHARAERLQALYEASDRSQDASAMRCATCGAIFDGFEWSKCPECSSEEYAPAA